MPKLKYSYALKYQALLELSQGKNAWDICAKYEILSGPTILAYWKKRYNSLEELKYLAAKDEIYMSKVDNSKEMLEEKIRRLEKEAKEHKKEHLELRKKYEAQKAKNEVLKKWDPSCQMNDMKDKTNNRMYKHYAFNEIYIREFAGIFSNKFWCEVFGVSESKYYAFKNRFSLVSKKDSPELMYPPFLPEFKDKKNPKMGDYIEQFYTEFKQSAGSERIRDWIRDELNDFISKESIREYQLKNPYKCPVANRKSSIRTSKTTANTRVDLIKDNYSTTRPGEKIGVDGTWFKDVFIAGKRKKILCEIAYDWFSRTVVAYTFGITEDSNIVLRTVNGTLRYLSKNEYVNCIIQMDRGAANRANELVVFEKSQGNFVISMSEKGFKHNSVTESLNGWVKENFYASYGNHFNTFEDFYISFNTFIKSRNKLQKFVYNNKKERELNR